MELTIIQEILKAFGRFFMNPIVYWIVLLMIMSSHDRIKKERFYFSLKIAPLIDETKQTLKIALLATLTLALLTLGVGVAFTYEIIIIFTSITFLLSIMYRLSTLSASYALGLTYLMLFFLPDTSKIIQQITPLTMTSLSLMIGILLCFEAMMFLQLKENNFYPTLIRSRRGLWYGLQHLKRLAVIPVVALVPKGPLTPLGDFWPFFTIADQSYTIFIFPVLVGFHHVVTGELPQRAAQRLGRFVLSLAFFVIIFSLLSIQLPGLSLFAVLIAIVCRILIQWQYYRKDIKRSPLFIEGDHQVKVLGVVQDSPAQKLGFITGETIQKVNDKTITSVAQLKQILNEQYGQVTFEVIGLDNKIRRIKNDTYRGNDLELGLILMTKPASSQSK